MAFIRLYYESDFWYVIYNNVNCSQSKLKVHKLYIAGTIEEARLKKEKLSANHEVIQNVNSDISAQNFDDIVC